MFIDQLFDAGALPTLARSMQFAARRQELIAHNIANISTPGFVQKDVSVRAFQASLGDAVDRRRARTGGSRGTLNIAESREVRFSSAGDVRLTPKTPRDGVLFHDRNNRSVERLMQDMVENMTAFRVAGDLLKSRLGILRSAISGSSQ